MNDSTLQMNTIINSLNVLGLLRLHYLIGKHDEKREMTDDAIVKIEDRLLKFEDSLSKFEKELHTIKRLIDELVRKSRNKSKA